MEQLREHKLRVIAAVAVVGFGLLQGARLLDGGSGPYSQDEFALYGLLVDGLTFLTVALLSYFAKIERPDTLFVVGVSATVAYVLLAMVGPVSVPWMLVKQTCAGMSWATNILCWMYVFTCYRPRIALLMIALGYAVDAAIQPLLGDLGTAPLVFVPVYLLSVFLLWLCLRKSDAVAAAMHEPSIPKTTLQEAFSRTHRAIVATFAFSFVCGFVVESDALLAGALYSQTVLTAWMCLGVAVVMVLLLSLFRVRKVNMDYISPVAAICIATVLALRYFGVGDVAFSGGLMTATLISFYVFLWLMFVSEAFERTLPAFFLLGLALAVARISVACGRFSALVASSVMPLDETAIIVAMMWALVITVSGVFIAQRSYVAKLGRRAYDVAEGERGGTGLAAMAGQESEGGVSGDAAALGSAMAASTDAGLLDVSAQERALERLMAEGGLSARESDILRDFATGRTARYIADWYLISEHTVKTHLRRAYAKLDVHSRQELLDRMDEIVAEEYRQQAMRRHGL